MALATVTEFRGLLKGDSKDYDTLPRITEIVTSQSVTFTTSAPCNAFNENTKFIRVAANADCHIKGGPSGGTTATTSDAFLPAGAVEYFRVHPGMVVAFYDGVS
jgi:hypothetical protein